LQVSASQHASARSALQERAAQRIAEVARRHKSSSMMALAVTMKLDSFTKVKEMMDKMIVALSQQLQDEYNKHEACNQEIDTLQDNLKVAQNEKEDLDEKMTSLQNALSTYEKEVAKQKQDIAEMEAELKKAGETRKEESKSFQLSLKDQKATVSILTKVHRRLFSFYTKKSMLQAHAVKASKAAAAPAPAAAVMLPVPPPLPGNYAKSGGAQGVLQLLAMVIKDAEVAEQQLKRDEQKAQASYETLVEDTTNSINIAQDTVKEMFSQIAEAKGDKSETKAAQISNGERLTELRKLLHAQHLDCDFLIKYFSVRQKALSEEISAIKDAKAILSGMKK